MSNQEHQRQNHHLEEELPFQNIDRERSLEVLRSIQRLQAKSLVHHERQKEGNHEVDNLQEKRFKILQQIEDKLATAQRVYVSPINQLEKTDDIHQRLCRLQALMDQFRGLKQLKDQSKTMFVRQKDNYNVQNQQTTSFNIDAREHHQRSKLNYQVLLREIQRARSDVREIHRTNKRIFHKKGDHQQSPQSQRNAIQKRQYLGKKQNQSLSRSCPFEKEKYEAPLLRQSQNRQKKGQQEERQTLINELKHVSQDYQAQRSSFPTQQQVSSLTIVHEGPNSQLNYPSEVLYSWRKGDSFPYVQRLQEDGEGMKRNFLKERRI